MLFPFHPRRRRCCAIAFAAITLSGAAAWPVFAGGLETVVVTASPPDPVGNDAFSVMRLSGADLQSSQQLDVALEQVPGLSLYRRNSSLSANPTVQGVSLRSIAPSGAGRALVTLDGVPQNDPFGGWVIWSALPPEDVASAEIVRGAGAGPYGAGALTGVIALTEDAGNGLTRADASWGERESGRAAAAGGAQWGPVSLFASGAISSTAGWIAVSPAQRGAADTPVTLNARSASLRAESEVWSGTILSGRIGLYDEARHSGLQNTASEASGLSLSATLAHPAQTNAPGWRLQAWLRKSDLQNSSAAVSADRSATTPANDQYTTPATGWGISAALRDSLPWLDWEVGADARFADGESREHFGYSAGQFTQNRRAGGRTFVGGVYAEGASHIDRWLLTLGVRADEWTSSSGHLIQSRLSDGTVTLMQTMPSRSGAVPTARAGARYAISPNIYLRGAAYAGFRAPSLNELYRPFRVGNLTTQANAALSPEELYGVELGAGGGNDALSWSATVFFNQLHGAITNVTIGPNLQQRQNAGNINAPGIEADARYRLSKQVALRAAFSLSDAHVDGKAQVPQLTGLRPAQTPRWTVTGGASIQPWDRLTIDAGLRFEGARFADDRNLLRLGSALTADARISYRLYEGVSAYIAGDNLFNTDVASTESQDGIISYDAPRMVRFGLSYTH